MKRVNIYKFERNSRSNWLLLVNKDEVYLHIQGNDCFYQFKKWKRGYISGDLLRLCDSHDYGVTFEGLNRPISRKHVKDFLNEFSGYLPAGVELRLKNK